MNIKSKDKFINTLILTDAFNSIEKTIYNKHENRLDSFIKDADNTFDNIYTSNQLFNPDYSIKLLYNKKIKNLKRKNLNLYSINSLKGFSSKTINLKKNKFKNNQRNKNNNFTTTLKFNSYDNNRNKKKNHLNIGFNTINYFNNFNNYDNHENNNEFISNVLNKQKKVRNSIDFNGSDKDNILIKNQKDYIIKINKDEEKIIKALKKNKIKLLKFHKDKFVKEKEKEKKLNKIEKQIENKTNSLFYKNKGEENTKMNDVDNKNLNDDNIQNYRNEKINLKTFKIKKPNKSKSQKNFNILSNLNYKIYKNCVKNIKLDKNFSNIIKSINKQRLSQYNININRKIKSEENWAQNNKLLNNQKKEVNFHKRELVKKEEKEKLYNNFKKQIKERFIHKNLKIDSISKISTKLAFLGRKYFIKNFNYDYLKDKDFLFENYLQNSETPKKKRLHKIEKSCEKVISNIEKMEKRKNKILKRIEIDEEKYNKNENGYYFSVDNKDIIKKPIINLSKKIINHSDDESDEDEKTNNKSNNDIKKENKKINERLLPKINFIMSGLSFDKF